MSYDTNIMRLLIEQSKAAKFRKYEMWDFVRLTGDYTGLPYDIHVDNGGAYLNNNHKLWLYVDTKHGKIPITIEDNPKFVCLSRDVNFNYSSIIYFIRKNKDLLKNLADGKVDISVFFQILKKLNESEIIKEGVDLICEMATLKKEKTMLPTIIWLDDDNLYKKHAPRIKFRANFQNKDTRKDPSMEVNEPDRIHNLPKKIDLTNKQINHIKYFVIANKEIILSLMNKNIALSEFLKSMKIVDENGNIIVNENNGVVVGDYINGFAKCEKNGKFNFINSNGDYLFDGFYLDSASDFTSYINDMLLAYVSINGDYFYINTKGEKVDIK